jgi:hypothetical protein
MLLHTKEIQKEYIGKTVCSTNITGKLWSKPFLYMKNISKLKIR